MSTDFAWQASGIGGKWCQRNTALAKLARAYMAYEKADDKNAREGVTPEDGDPVITALDKLEIEIRKFMTAELDYLHACATYVDATRDVQSEGGAA